MTENEAIEKHIQENNNRIENIKFFMNSNPDANIDDCKRNIEILAISNNALEKQIPKKPIMKPYFDDMEEEYLCCPTCGEILTDRIPFENKDFYFHCLKCGQAFDWSDTD